MVVREATFSDIPKLASLAQLTYTATFGHSMTASELDWELRENRSEESFQRALPCDTVLVVDDETDLVGYIQIADGEQKLKAIYVHPERQGQGIGKLLMDVAMTQSRFINATRITLDVWPDNKKAIGLYKHYGFVQSGTYDFIVDGKVVGTDWMMTLDKTENS